MPRRFNDYDEPHYGAPVDRDYGGIDAGYRGDRDFFPRESFRGRGPRNYVRSESRIREDLCELLTLDHEIDATDVEVTVRDNVAVLNGSVSGRGAKRRAERLAESVPGVRNVENNLRVLEPQRRDRSAPDRDDYRRHEEEWLGTNRSGFDRGW